MVNMKIENQKLEIFNCQDIENNSQLVLKNCIIENLNFDLFNLECYIVIQNCEISNFSVHSCWFKNGLLLEKNIFHKRIEYYMGGHNNLPILIYGNTFNEFVDFNDCVFSEKIELKDNLFKKGTNLFGNLDDAAKNTFEGEVIVENNKGNLDMDGWG